MRKKQVNNKKRYKKGGIGTVGSNYETGHEDSARNRGSVGAHGGDNPAHADAGELKYGKHAVSKEANKIWKEVGTANKIGFKQFISSGAGKALLVFSALVILDYFLTIYAIRRHFSEFNPLTVLIYKNFQNPEIIFFLFKITVIGFNGLLVYLMLWMRKTKKIFRKIALAYALLAATFAFAVVVYDIGIMTGALALPDVANDFIFGFFKFFGMV